ncbi:unnamed protein product [Protopolystoma xenopodis]|uniref:Uncharacterized protein n=1 Tax=Protopolystoma xenopodis TaxID=117903 RepID=A0A448WRZ6_9PLAT|nr:unnamed protein product [Protopolystoma xenopodis]
MSECRTAKSTSSGDLLLSVLEPRPEALDQRVSTVAGVSLHPPIVCLPRVFFLHLKQAERGFPSAGWLAER